MEWWQIIPTIVLIIGLLIEAYVRLGPALRKQREDVQHAKASIRKALEDAINKAKEYRYPRLSKLQEMIEGAHISGKLRRQLTEITNLAEEYEKWLHESFQVIKSEVIAQSKGLENLDEVFTYVFHSGLESVFGGTENSLSENIYKAIYKNGLTFDMAKESVLKGHWDTKVTVRDKRGEEKELMLKDIIDSGEFHRFIENLIKLQNRESIRTLRDAQARFLEKARLILKE